jgi:hypothetical protein
VNCALDTELCEDQDSRSDSMDCIYLGQKYGRPLVSWELPYLGNDDVNLGMVLGIRYVVRVGTLWEICISSCYV